MNPNRPQLWMDSETGGLDAEVHSPIQFAFLAVHNGVICDRLEIYFAVEPFVVTSDALLTTGINLLDLRKRGVPTFQRAREIYSNFMTRNFFTKLLVNPDNKTMSVYVKPSKENMPFFCGHNTFFDRPWLKRVMGSDFDFCYYHRIDTMVLANTLRDMGLLPVENCKLETLIKHFDIKIPEGCKLHNALTDVEATFEVYKRLQGLVNVGPISASNAQVAPHSLGG